MSSRVLGVYTEEAHTTCTYHTHRHIYCGPQSTEDDGSCSLRVPCKDPLW